MWEFAFQRHALMYLYRALLPEDVVDGINHLIVCLVSGSTSGVCFPVGFMCAGEPNQRLGQNGNTKHPRARGPVHAI